MFMMRALSDLSPGSESAWHLFPIIIQAGPPGVQMPTDGCDVLIHESYSMNTYNASVRNSSHTWDPPKPILKTGKRAQSPTATFSRTLQAARQACSRHACE
jgi:hypothetical protein